MPGPPSATLIRATPSAASAAALNQDGLAAAVFDGVGNQVVEDLLDRQPVAKDAKAGRRKIQGNGRAGIARLRLEGGHHSTGDLADIDFLMFKMQLTGGQSRYVEKRRRALDEACYQPIDLLQVLRQLFHRELALCDGSAQKCYAAYDGRQWIAQLVRREGQQVGPGGGLLGQACVLLGQFANAPAEFLNRFVVRHRNTGRITRAPY
jgi:hypothetical protein